MASKGFLLYLADLTLSQLKTVVKSLTRNQLKAVKELFVNILKGNVHLDTKSRKALAPYKKFLRQLARKGIAKCKLSKTCTILLNVLKAAKQSIESL